MILTLRQKQGVFISLIPKLILRFHESFDRNGNLVEIQAGEMWRSPETCELYAKEGKGIIHSCHDVRLAWDLNLFVNAQLSNSKMDYEPLGAFWKAFSTPDYLCAWGGDFSSFADIYHFSIEHNGVR